MIHLGSFTLQSKGEKIESNFPSIVPFVTLVTHWLVVSDSSATPWTVAPQAPLSMGLPRQEYWNSLPFPSPEDLPDPGFETVSPALAGRFLTMEPRGKPL